MKACSEVVTLSSREYHFPTPPSHQTELDHSFFHSPARRIGSRDVGPPTLGFAVGRTARSDLEMDSEHPITMGWLLALLAQWLHSCALNVVIGRTLTKVRAAKEV